MNTAAQTLASYLDSDTAKGNLYGTTELGGANADLTRTVCRSRISHGQGRDTPFARARLRFFGFAGTLP
jgi:hypothetical protein